MPISRAAVLDWITASAGAIAAERDTLDRLDAAVGDAEHGTNLDRGFQAVLGKLPDLADQDIGAIL